METMMQVSILGRRPIPAGSGTVPTVAMDLHFRENGWTYTETISVTSDAPEQEQLDRAARVILRRNGKRETYDWA